MEMSNILTAIVNESLSHILNALETSQPNNIQKSSEELDSESENIGKQISRCSAQADNDIQAAIKQFFFVFNPIHNKSLIVLNTVLEQIAEWNTSSDPSVIVDKVQNVLEAQSTEFELTIVPSLEDELRKFKRILFLIPASVSKCVNGALNNWMDYVE